MTTSGSATVSGSGYATGDVTIDLTASGCDLTLSGSGSIDVPEPECADGMSTSGSASITTSGGASGGGDISLSLSGCTLSLSGSVDIWAPSACSDLSGVLCDSDITTTSLSVCDSSGGTSSITVLTYA